MRTEARHEWLRSVGGSGTTNASLELLVAEVQACRERHSRPVVLRASTTKCLTAHERHIPNDIDSRRVQTDYHTFHAKRNSSRSRLLDHDDAVAETEGLSLQTVSSVLRFEHSLTWDALDQGSLEARMRLVALELASEFLNGKDRILQSQQSVQ